MASEIDFAPLLLVCALAFLIPLLVHRVSGGAMPSVVGEILAGVVFGSSVLGIIEDNVWLEFLSLFGFAYLMFLAGLEVDVALLMRPLGRRRLYPRVALRHPLVAGVLLLVSILAVTAGGVALINDWGKADDFPLLFLVLSATAVGIMAPVLKERGGLGGYAQVLLVAGFLVEFVGIVGIGIVAAIDRGGLGVEALLLLALPAVFVLLLLSVRHGSTRVPELAGMMSELAHASSQIQIRGALALLVIFVVLSQVVGTELVLGAFFAGLALAILSPKHGSSMRIKLDALGYGFFIPIFFITVGATLDLSALGEGADAALLIPAFLLIGLLAKLLPGLLILWPAFGPRRAAAGGVLLSANLSLVLAAITIAEDSGRFEEATSAALLVLALVTTAAAPLGFNALLPRRGAAARARAIVVGASDTGRYVALRLHREGMTVVVVDRDAAALAPLAQAGCRTVVGDARDAAIIARVRPEISEGGGDRGGAGRGRLRDRAGAARGGARPAHRDLARPGRPSPRGAGRRCLPAGAGDRRRAGRRGAAPGALSGAGQRGLRRVGGGHAAQRPRDRDRAAGSGPARRRAGDPDPARGGDRDPRGRHAAAVGRPRHAGRRAGGRRRCIPDAQRPASGADGGRGDPAAPGGAGPAG